MNIPLKQATRSPVRGRALRPVTSLVLLLATAAATSATDLPWVYDTSERTAADGGASEYAVFSPGLVTMVGRWWLATAFANLRTLPWDATTLFVR